MSVVGANIPRGRRVKERVADAMAPASQRAGSLPKTLDDQGGPDPQGCSHPQVPSALR
jgi:hypothetical protein